MQGDGEHDGAVREGGVLADDVGEVVQGEGGQADDVVQGGGDENDDERSVLDNDVKGERGQADDVDVHEGEAEVHGGRGLDSDDVGGIQGDGGQDDALTGGGGSMLMNMTV